MGQNMALQHFPTNSIVSQWIKKPRAICILTSYVYTSHNSTNKTWIFSEGYRVVTRQARRTHCTPLHQYNLHMTGYSTPILPHYCFPNLYHILFIFFIYYSFYSTSIHFHYPHYLLFTLTYWHSPSVKHSEFHFALYPYNYLWLIKFLNTLKMKYYSKCNNH